MTIIITEIVIFVTAPGDETKKTLRIIQFINIKPSTEI